MHLIRGFIYREFYNFAEPSEGTFQFLLWSRGEPYNFSHNQPLGKLVWSGEVNQFT